MFFTEGECPEGTVPSQLAQINKLTLDAGVGSGMDKYRSSD